MALSTKSTNYMLPRYPSRTPKKLQNAPSGYYSRILPSLPRRFALEDVAMRVRFAISLLAASLLPGSLQATPLEAAAVHSAAVVSLDGPGWLLAPDPQNVGRDGKWWERPAAGAKSASVPGIIQEAFPMYHGVAWYWRDLTPPANPHAEGRYLLRFWNVDYLADVWLNGVHVGRHEGACEPFVLDVTDAVRPQAVNRLAVRVLNPTDAADRRHPPVGDRPHGQVAGVLEAGPRRQLGRPCRFGRIDRLARRPRRGPLRPPRSQDRPDPRTGQFPQRRPSRPSRRRSCCTSRRPRAARPWTLCNSIANFRCGDTADRGRIEGGAIPGLGN